MKQYNFRVPGEVLGTIRKVYMAHSLNEAAGLLVADVGWDEATLQEALNCLVSVVPNYSRVGFIKKPVH